jgi:hypothetical protein
MTDFVVAVRTYERAEIFRTHTLKTLREQGLEDRLYVFVGSDIEAYKALEPSLRYIQAQKGGHNAIRCICEYFPRGTPILFMDDDLKGFKQYIKETDSFITTGFLEIIEEGFKHAPFTVGFLTNKLWLRKSPRMRPSYGCMIGNIFGAFNEPELITTTHAHLDDTLRAIQYMKLKRVPTVFPGVSFKTSYAKTPGGLQASGDRIDTMKVCEEIAEQVEGWCSEIVKHKEGPYAWKWLPPATIRKKLKEMEEAGSDG